MSNFLYFISCFFISFSELYVWSKFYCEKINFRKIYFYISIILMMLFGMINYFYINAYIRVIVVTFLLCFCNWLVFRKKISEVTISTIYGQFILAFSDIIGVLIVSFFFHFDFEALKSNIFGSLIGNVVPSFIFVAITFIPFIQKVYLKLVQLTMNIKQKHIIILSFLIMTSINFLSALMYYKSSSIYVIILNTLLLLIYSYIVYKIISEKNNNIVIKSQNDSLMKSLHQYEDMVDRQRVYNHENKNQLLIIKNMINKKDKDVIKYIETIVKDQKEDDEILYTRVMTIPSGGLQGIVYQKMLVMKDEHIKFSLDVGRGVKNVELEKLSMDDNYRLCKIIGVLLDNAIEESRKVDDKCIMISLFVDDGELVIEVSNKYEGKIDVDRLDESGYTTKGDGHGYGLSLVKKILSETDIFENERIIKKNVFKQVVKVKLKNT